MNNAARLELATNRRALFRITNSARRELEKLVFQRHPYREWGTFFRFGFRRTSWGLALTYVESLAPRPGDLDRHSGIVSFHPDYIDHAVDALEAGDLGLGVIHSHPSGIGVFPSSLDDDMDRHFGTEMFHPHAPDRPYASLIVNHTHPTGELSFSGRVYDCGEWFAVDSLYSAGRRLDRFSNALIPDDREHLNKRTAAILARWLRVVDPEKLNRLRNVVVAVIGCSGTGSPTIEALARAQIGELILIDPDRISLSNIERVHGSTLGHLDCTEPPFKVQIMAELIRSVNPDIKLTLIAGSSLDELSMDHLLRSDLIIGCTDSMNGRAHIGDLASRYLIPAIDVGVLPDGNDGRLSDQMIELTRLSPEDACPYCHGRIDPLALSAELMSESEVELAKKEAKEAIARGEPADAYWRDVPQLPSVGYLTTCAGALVGGYALNWLLGTAEMPHSRFQFDVGARGFGFTPDENEPKSSCGCTKFKGHSDQGELSITRPRRYPAAQLAKEL